MHLIIGYHNVTKMQLIGAIHIKGKKGSAGYNSSFFNPSKSERVYEEIYPAKGCGAELTFEYSVGQSAGLYTPRAS